VQAKYYAYTSKYVLTRTKTCDRTYTRI